MAYCPWNGVKDCGCGTYPFTENERMPQRCEELLPLDMVAAYLKPQRVSDAAKERYTAWAEAGFPPAPNDTRPDNG